VTSLPPDTLSSDSPGSLSAPGLDAFVNALDADTQYDRERLHTALDLLLAGAHKDHPALLDTESFLPYIAARLPGYLPAEQEVARIHASDLLLAKACAEGHEAALARFDDEFLGLVIVAGRKLKMGDMQCDELRQQVRLKLLVPGSNGAAPKIGNYNGTGALRSWVYATGLRTGLNELRRIGRAPMPAGDEQLLVAMPDRNDDQELQYMKELYRTAFKDSFKASIAALEDRLGNILRHYYLDEMTLEQIGALYRVHKTTVMRWVNKAHAELETETKQRMVAHLKLQPSEVESVMRLIQSGIQLGLASVLAIDESES
jgi:RNA polymerase sigma-70 factor (ECF subfamily)